MGGFRGESQCWSAHRCQVCVCLYILRQFCDYYGHNPSLLPEKLACCTDKGMWSMVYVQPSVERKGKYAQCMSNVYPGADQRKYQSPASLAFVREIHRSSMNSPRKWPVTRKMFPFDDVIMFFKSARGYIPWCSFTGIVYQRIRHGYEISSSVFCWM